MLISQMRGMKMVGYLYLKIPKEMYLSFQKMQFAQTIQVIFKILMRVIDDEGLDVSIIRIPAEPISPYLFSPSLYFVYAQQDFS